MYVFQLLDRETILKKGVVAAQFGDWAGLGALYLTDERLVFIGYARTSITTAREEEIPLEHIDAVRPVKTFALLANAMDITTIRGQMVKFTLPGRDEWVEAIRRQMDRI